MSDRTPLTRSSAGDDPIALLLRWIEDGAAAGIPEPRAAALATVTKDGAPAARVVLLKDVEEARMTFFTNYESEKADDLGADPRAALCLHWQPLRRQVRVTGAVVKVSAEESDAYFGSRPRGSQLSTWASRQSSVVLDRGALEQAFAEATERFEGAAVERPASWGGYALVPEKIEFWNHRDDRMHDRLLFTRDGDEWKVERLAP